MTIRLPTHFALAVECCAPEASHRASRAAQLAEIVDWARFLATCRRHRIQGLAWRTIRRLGLVPPGEIASQLESDSVQIATQGLKSASISAQLLRDFERAGIPILFVKGLTLSQLAHADPFVKMSHDIDILVPLAEIERAGAALTQLGYAQTLPRHRNLAAWHRVHKESVWTRHDHPTIELHSRLADNPGVIPAIDNCSPVQLVEVAPGITLPTLAPDELVAYLSVHGASSAWFRLKWIADFAAVLGCIEDNEIRRLVARGEQLGAGRAVPAALLLADDLFGIAPGQSLKQEIATPVSRWLARLGRGELIDDVEPTQQVLGTVAIHFSQLLLLPAGVSKRSEIIRQLKNRLF